jgi:hypothetical protein
MNSSMRTLALLCLSLPLAAAVADAAPPAPANPFEPMAFLAGHCWKGTFPGKPQTDQHCFEWVYEQRFLRDRHVVKTPGKPDYQGETIYYWDPDTKQIQYLYIESDGGYSKGTVSPAADGLEFPSTSYVNNGQEQVYRSRWLRSGDAGYNAVTEFQTKDGWKIAWQLAMQRQQ